MRLALLGLLGGLVGAAAVLVTVAYLRWIQTRVPPGALRLCRRAFFLVAFLCAVALPFVVGVDPMSAPDNTSGVVYWLGLMAGIAGAIVIRRRTRRTRRPTR